MLRTLPPLVFLVLASASGCGGCSGPVGAEGEGEGEGEGENQPGAPVPTITEPADGAFLKVGATTRFACTALDDIDGAIPNASLSWQTSGDGDIGNGGTVLNALVTLGDQTIACLAVDSDGLRGTDLVTVHVVDNLPPEVTIQNPPDGAFFAASQSINFVGRAIDPETNAAVPNTALRWFDGTAPLGVGAALTTALALGEHAITLEATDADGVVGTRTIGIHVVDNIPPLCTIQTPADGASLAAGGTTAFNVICLNPDGAAVQNGDVTWTSNVDGALGVGLQVITALTTRGAQHIIACAKDPADNTITGCDAVDVIVGDNASPTASIGRPNNNSTISACRDVELRCAGTDPEGQSTTVRWTDSAGDPIPQGGDVTWTPQSSGVHTLTCTATDALGASSSSIVTLTIASPSASIQDPQDGDQFTVGDTVQLRGNGCDTALGDLNGAALTWSSNLDGPLGSGSQLNTTGLQVGNHTLTLTASNGVSLGVDTIQIEIQN